MNKQTTSSTVCLTPEIQAALNAGILQFLNGESIERAKNDLLHLQDITITESYGELDKEDKWLMIDFIRRIGCLIDHFEHVIPNPSQA